MSAKKTWKMQETILMVETLQLFLVGAHFLCWLFILTIIAMRNEGGDMEIRRLNQG